MVRKGSEQFKPECCIYIVSYDLASKKAEEIKSIGFKACIADEAHYLKNRDAKRSQNLIPLF